MKKVVIFEKVHKCPIKKEHNRFARRMGSGLTEIEQRARVEKWVFCPWCGERLGAIEEAEYQGKIHLYETNSDQFNAIPESGKVFTVDCGRCVRVERVLTRAEIAEMHQEICPECLLQRPIFAAEHEYVLIGEVELALVKLLS